MSSGFVFAARIAAMLAERRVCVSLSAIGYYYAQQPLLESARTFKLFPDLHHRKRHRKRSEIIVH
jgi:hypothetical protein